MTRRWVVRSAGIVLLIVGVVLLLTSYPLWPGEVLAIGGAVLIRVSSMRRRPAEAWADAKQKAPQTISYLAGGVCVFFALDYRRPELGDRFASLGFLALAGLFFLLGWWLAERSK